jgi:hypothetical protein
VGGVQAAVIATFPAVEAATFPVLPKSELDPRLTPTVSGEVDVQVSGVAIRVIPTVSFTTALTVAVVPPGITSEGEDPGASCNEMDCTGQVVNCKGGEVTPATLAKMEVIPGLPAVAIC